MNTDLMVTLFVAVLILAVLAKIYKMLTDILTHIQSLPTWMDIPSYPIEDEEEEQWVDLSSILGDAPIAPMSIINWLDPDDVEKWEAREQQSREQPIHTPIFGKRTT